MSSTDHRFDPLGLAELDAALAPAAVFADAADELAAPCAFAELKQLFQQAVANLAHRKAAWLRTQVRAAEDPIDLWLLRGPLLAALREDDRATRTLRAAIYKSLDRAFPDAFAMPVSAVGAPRLAS